MTTTHGDVFEAERRADEAERLAAELEAAAESGAPAVTPDEVSAHAKVSSFAQLRARVLRDQAERYRRAAGHPIAQ